MSNIYNVDWQAIEQRFDLWWKQENPERPILSIKAPKIKGVFNTENDKWVESSGDTPLNVVANDENADYTNYWHDFDTIIKRNRGIFEQSHFCAETYPRLFANLGVTSLATFLGCTPKFAKDTIWYNHILDDPEAAKLVFDKNNEWLQWSLNTTKRAVAEADGDFNVGIPDLCEHLDVLASLFDTQELLFHMMDYEDEVIRLSKEVQESWFKAYDLHNAISTNARGFTNYGPFQLTGKGKIAKLQCDMSAMISTEMFDQFVLPFLDEQTRYLDNSLYHLDGPDAIKHLDSVLSLEKLSALQWTPGAGNEDGGDEEWDFIYEKALNAGKSIFVLSSKKNVKRIAKKFGSKGVLMMTSAQSAEEAEEIMRLATV